ncbi:HD domain-containing protein [Microbacterium timonense]|uniref:HD domain-containing protein n=1 Tax=Microbacterium timonense TaxID=2086576 RepID=UPI000D0F6AFE|nr:HD domain-containing protein [Microbacterium timonense]
MSELIAGVTLPRSSAVSEADRLVAGMVSPTLYDHSRRVYYFSTLHARRLGLEPDAELLYLAAIFHDSGLLTPFSSTPQRFEVDGADHAHAFLLSHGFSPAAADTVWTAIALHTTPGIPGRMGPEIATLYLGVLTDVLGFGLNELDRGKVDDIVAAIPRGDFKNGFLQAVVQGLRDRPDTANGTVNSDILEHYLPHLHRTTTVERVLGAPWAS